MFPGACGSYCWRLGPAPGESDILIYRHQARVWQCGVWFDNAGSHHAGRYRRVLQLALGKLAELSDRLLVTLSHEVGLRDRLQAGAIMGHYSVPIGYWLLGLSARDDRSHQWIACQRRHYRYSGHQRSWSGLIHRDGQAKTTVSGDWWVSDSDTRLNQRPLRPQSHRTHTWRLGITHRRILPGGALEVAVNYRRGTRWGSAGAADQRMPRFAGKTRKCADGRANVRHGAREWGRGAR
ncbi:MAG: ShlB/FhaC/HecB family hemolysin secretion/activation protein [Sodalis sp. (in: enterobacteria)]|uniref:ShlB/FhaC/HecB family hemolysin secretion/activation protein n=1 Tax=Sodalis sp. (in: enterobacteria) TaxID=1898979 RepID=UPI003F315FF2